MLGVIFSILCAATFALNATAARRAVLSGTVVQGLMVTVPLGVPLFAALVTAVGEWRLFGQFPLEAYGWFAAAGVVHFVIGRYGNYASAGAIGTNLAAPILQSEVIITLILAMVLLGESLTPLRALGILLIMIGPSLISGRDDGKKVGSEAATTPDAKIAPVASGSLPVFRPRYAEGYAYAALAAVAYGCSPICIGLGLKAAGGAGVIAGGLVSYLAATVAVGLILMTVPASTFRLNRTALGWFAFAGVFVFLSQAFRYAAMGLAPVSVVTALQRLSSLFRIYFSWLMNRTTRFSTRA